MSRLHTSPLGAELDAARDEGRSEVIELVLRRRRPVRATRLADELTDAPKVDREAVRGAAAERAVREMWWLMDVEVDGG